MAQPTSGFKITLPLPPTDNHCYGQRGKIRFMYPEAKHWKEMAWLQLKLQYGGEIKKGNVVIGEIIFYLKHWRDIQGSLKLLFDVMQGIVYENDRQVVQFCVFKKEDKVNPRIEIII